MTTLSARCPIYRCKIALQVTDKDKVLLIPSYNTLGQYQVIAVENIKAGQEISFNYLDQADLDDEFVGFRNRQYGQKILFEHRFFYCSCDLCESDGDITGFDEMILEAEKLSIKRKSATDAVRSRDPDGSLNYSLEECRQEINCYKRMYSLGKIQKIHPCSLFDIVERAFYATSFGHYLHESTDLKGEAVKFAKALDKLSKILGNVPRGTYERVV